MTKHWCTWRKFNVSNETRMEEHELISVNDIVESDQPILQVSKHFGASKYVPSIPSIIVPDTCNLGNRLHDFVIKQHSSGWWRSSHLSQRAWNSLPRKTTPNDWVSGPFYLQSPGVSKDRRKPPPQPLLSRAQADQGRPMRCWR